MAGRAGSYVVIFCGGLLLVGYRLGFVTIVRELHDFTSGAGRINVCNLRCVV